MNLIRTDSLYEVLLPILCVDNLPVGREWAKGNVVHHHSPTDSGKVGGGSGPVLFRSSWEGLGIIAWLGSPVEVSLKHPTLEEGATCLQIFELLHRDEPVVDARSLVNTRLSCCAYRRMRYKLR